MPDPSLKSLNSEQKEAVMHNDGPLLIIAGAGTGKTVVITQKIAHLINSETCKPEEILALTFTDKAAGEMEERVDRLLPYGYVDLWISTFHSFAERVLKEYGIEIGLPSDFKLLNTTDAWLLVRQNLNRFDLDYYRPLGNPTKFIHDLLKHFSRAKDENVDVKKYHEFVARLKNDDKFANKIISKDIKDNLSESEIQDITDEEIKKYTEIASAYETYQQLLLDNNSLDFGDLINYCLKLFETRKNVLSKYRSQFKYILVDEFQDTNYAQYRLVQLLAHPRNNITVVGDDDQSIFKFRGTSVFNIMKFKDDYPNTKDIFLTKNYRSGQNILDLSYKFIQQNNPNRLEVKLSKGRKISKKLISPTNKSGFIKHIHGTTAHQEAVLVSKQIVSLKKENPNIGWSDFAILVRANSHASEFINTLEKFGIPFDYVASKGLYAKGIVLDITSYLKLLDNYHESIAMYRILSLPIWQISAHETIELTHWSKRQGISLYQSMKSAESNDNISNRGKEVIKNILEFIQTHSQLVKDGKPTTEIIQAFLRDTGYLKFLTQEENLAKREEINFLSQFYKKVQDFENDFDDTSIKNFLDLMSLELESGERGSIQTNMEDGGPDTVKILTVHSAKGLEYEHVFVTNLVTQRFPSTNRRDAIRLPEILMQETVPEGDIHLQEERRLFYVAMTRAKSGLYLSSAEDYGGTRAKKLSRFMTELEEQGLILAQSAKGDASSELDSKKAIIRPASKLPEGFNAKKLNKFSFTQLQTYDRCPYQYFLSYILRVPTKGSKNFSFGTTMHNTLQKFFQAKGLYKDQKELLEDKTKISLDQLLEIYEDSFIDAWYPDQETKDKYRLKGEKSLKDFYAKYQSDWPLVKHLEYPFTLKIKGEEVYSIYGRIDRVDQLGKSVRIVDYKTGAAKKKLHSDDKDQLLIYQIAIVELMEEEVGELVFYYLDNNQEISFLGSEKDLIKIKNKIITSIERIRAIEFDAKPSLGAKTCQWCDFKDICEYRLF